MQSKDRFQMAYDNFLDVISNWPGKMESARNGERVNLTSTIFL
jgi:hypothetical protein